MKIVYITKENIDLFAPYSGICIHGEQQIEEAYDHETDPTCLFVYFEEFGWSGVSERVEEQLEKLGVTDYEDLTPVELANRLEFDGALMIEYNGGWNGMSWYAFAPE
ncbi:hypothetical protein MT391_00075 [Vibrio sp. 1-Bac 57]